MNTNDQNNPTLGERGAANQGKGALDNVAGKIQEGIGKATKDRSMQAKGKARQAKGTLQGKAGQAQQKIDDATRP